MSIKTSIGSRIFDLCNVIFMIGFALIMLYPMLYVFFASISSNAMVAGGQVIFWPKDVTLAAYEKLMSGKDLWVSYGNTIRYTVLQTVLTLIATSAMAYPLAKRWLPLRKPILFMAAFTLLFGGGMIPTFLVVQKLGMLNSIWAIVIPTLINTWYLFIMRTFFEALPVELEEAAIIDGCGPVQVLVRIIIPLSIPVFVTIGLFTAVQQWNSFFEALIYLSDRTLYPLQLMLRNLLLQNLLVTGALPEAESEVSTLETQKYALIMIATLPILCVYPFVQRYFVQGSLIGGVKG